MAAPIPHDRRSSRRLPVARVFAGVIAALVVACLVWLAGFDVGWSLTSALVLLPLSAVIASFALDEPPAWDRPQPRTPRGTRLRARRFEAALAACDRLARPRFTRALSALRHSARDDQLARAQLVRDVRTLLVAALNDAGIEPSAHTDRASALLGPHALSMLQPGDDMAITAATVTRSLDAIERLAAHPHQSS